MGKEGEEEEKKEERKKKQDSSPGEIRKGGSQRRIRLRCFPEVASQARGRPKANSSRAAAFPKRAAYSTLVCGGADDHACDCSSHRGRIWDCTRASMYDSYRAYYSVVFPIDRC